MSRQYTSLHGQIAAHTRWAHTADRSAATAPARKAFIARFERLVDPEGVLPLDERRKRAESAKKAHMLRLAAASAAARKRKSAA